jgi:hypothetical protein
MKCLFIQGDDYAALSFRRIFKGTPVSEVIADTEKFAALYEEHEDGGYIELDVYDLNVDEATLAQIVDLIGDHDAQKHADIFTEYQILKG